MVKVGDTVRHNDLGHICEVTIVSPAVVHLEPVDLWIAPSSHKIEEFNRMYTIESSDNADDPKDFTPTPKECSHEWETKALFTSTYEKCKLCGEEK